MSVWNKRETIDIKISLRSYLYTSTIYKVYDFFRKNSKMVTTELLDDFDKKIQPSNPETILMHTCKSSAKSGLILTN